MIYSRSDLKEYLKADYQANKIKRPFFQWLSRGELFCVYNFLKNLRHLEYCLNTKSTLPLIWYRWNHRRLKLKYQFFIEPNTVGKGISIMHPGFRRWGPYVKIGENVTVLPNTIIAKKNPEVSTLGWEIGDGCYIGYGVCILGPIKIGRNVTIAAGSVVTKDIPDNAVVAGVPAKIINNNI